MRSSNSIDEAREGHGTEIVTTRYVTARSKSLTMAAVSRSNGTKTSSATTGTGLLASCNAGGKAKNDTGENYEFSLLSQRSRYLRDGIPRSTWTSPLSVTASSTACTFEKGRKQDRHQGSYTKKRDERAQTGTTVRWKPDLRYSRISTPVDYYLDTPGRQAVVTSHIKFVLKIRWQQV